MKVVGCCDQNLGRPAHGCQEEEELEQHPHRKAWVTNHLRTLGVEARPKCADGFDAYESLFGNVKGIGHKVESDNGKLVGSSLCLPIRVFCSLWL